jgi:hypothetical protein
MSPSECAEVGSNDLMSEVCHSFSAGVVLYADIRGELGGESGMKRFPSTIGTFKDESWEVEIWLGVWLNPSDKVHSQQRPVPAR